MDHFARAQSFGTLLVGLEDDPDDGSLRVYVGHRATGTHTHVSDEAAKDQLRRAWGQGGHVVIPEPPADALCNCPEPTPVTPPTLPEFILAVSGTAPTWEPLCEPGGSGGGFKAGWMHLTDSWTESLCGKPFTDGWKRWGLEYPPGDLHMLMAQRAWLCSECYRLMWPIQRKREARLAQTRP